MRKSLTILLGAGLVLAAQAQFTGSLADFGVDLGGYAFSGPTGGVFADLVPGGGGVGHSDLSASEGAFGNVDWTVWDGYGYHGNAGFAGSYHDLRNFGGQQFDAKAMYITSDFTYLYVGLVTGFDPNGVHDPYGRNRTYTPGDFAINPDFAHGTSQYGIIVPTAPVGSNGATALMQGGRWWSPDADVGWAGPCLSNYKTGGTNMGSIADVRTSALTYGGHNVVYFDPTTNGNKQMYLYEARVKLSDIGITAPSTVGVSWAVSCNNDFIDGHHSCVVPEPSMLFGIAGSLSGLVFLRRRKQA